jgi:serine/threonine protein kinase
VIKLHEVYENENYIYLVKELLKGRFVVYQNIGGELFSKLKKHTSYSEKYVAQIVLRLLSALEYIHANNILHRDIKPENLILRSRSNDYDICLADFGLADYYDPEGNYMFKRCGTPGYVAPELL